MQSTTHLAARLGARPAIRVSHQTLAASAPSMQTALVAQLSRTQIRNYAANKLPMTVLGDGESTTAPPPSKYLKDKASYSDARSRNVAYGLIGAFGFVQAVAAKNIAVNLVGTLAASADVLALAKIEVNQADIPEGKNVVLKWRGKPVFIRHRTAADIAEANSVDIATLRHKETDVERVKEPEWLVMMGVCTHLGCVPIGDDIEAADCVTLFIGPPHSGPYKSFARHKTYESLYPELPMDVLLERLRIHGGIPRYILKPDLSDDYAAMEAVLTNEDSGILVNSWRSDDGT
ncbi:hypothetical protein HDU81_002865 [Chytriomyces hyalinus]|nr:hypothetical protein HDU81_002865 [Chytriomyces hyalinus]